MYTKLLFSAAVVLGSYAYSQAQTSATTGNQAPASGTSVKEQELPSGFPTGTTSESYATEKKAWIEENPEQYRELNRHEETTPAQLEEKKKKEAQPKN